MILHRHLREIEGRRNGLNRSSSYKLRLRSSLNASLPPRPPFLPLDQNTLLSNFIPSTRQPLFPPSPPPPSRYRAYSLSTNEGSDYPPPTEKNKRALESALLDASVSVPFLQPKTQNSRKTHPQQPRQLPHKLVSIQHLLLPVPSPHLLHFPDNLLLQILLCDLLRLLSFDGLDFGRTGSVTSSSFPSGCEVRFE